MSENLYISEGLESLLPERFKDQLVRGERYDVETEQVSLISLYSKDGIDRFTIEFLTDHESARNVLMTSLHKTITLPQYFGSLNLTIDGIEVKEPGPTLTLSGLVTYK